MVLRDGQETIAVTLDKERHARLEVMDLIDLAQLPELKGEEVVSYLDQLILVERDAEGVLQSVRAYNPRAIQVLLWGAVRWEDPALTLREFGQIMNAAIKGRVVTVLDCALLANAAWALGFPPPQQDADPKNAEAEATAH